MNVCPLCFDQPGLRNRLIEIRPQAPSEEKCEFHPTRKAVPMSAVARIVDEVFRQRYVHGRYHPMLDDFMGQDLRSALFDLTEYGEERICDGLIQELEGLDFYWPGDGEGPFYSDDASYELDQERMHQHGMMWASLCRRLVHGQRFFNQTARQRMEQIFAGIHRQRDGEGRPAVYMIEPGDPQSRFFRARMADDYDVRRRIHQAPARELGPPPPRRRTSGRLNPSGIAAFYGAFDRQTCHAELRPAVGSIVVSAQFALTSPICVLDTTRFAAPERHHDPFHKHALEQSGQWQFMRNFMDEIAKPILPSDEHLDYVPTQAVAEYLAHHHTFELRSAHRRIDAIIFQSAQTGRGKNIALLGAAASVELPDDMRVPFEDRFPHLDPWDLDGEEPPKILPRLRLVDGSVEDRKVARALIRAVPHDDHYPVGANSDGNRHSDF
ncbi:RES domain protein [compost metagenome]